MTIGVVSRSRFRQKITLSTSIKALFNVLISYFVLFLLYGRSLLICFSPDDVAIFCDGAVCLFMTGKYNDRENMAGEIV